jgi:hypothetical protein
LTASVIICLSMRFDARRGIHAKRSAVTG